MRPSIFDVFVPGGLPRLTYVERKDDGGSFDSQLRDYLRERHKVLAIVGPTKCGKSVLVRKVVDGALYIPGGSIRTVDDFWSFVVDVSGAYQEETRERVKTMSSGGDIGTEVGISHLVTAKFRGGEQAGTSSGKRQAFSRTRSDHQAGLRKLMEKPESVLFIDDFHYVPAPAQADIVRELRNPIFDGLAVIVAAVPHRAFDVTRVERDMTGRVKALDIPPWTESDLAEIALLGFNALDVATPRVNVDRLARESFGTPLLMQDMCLQLCKDNGLAGSDVAEPPSEDRPSRSPRSRGGPAASRALGDARSDPLERRRLHAPGRFPEFFARVSSQSPKDSYRRLVNAATDKTYLVDALGRQIGLADAILKAIAVSMRRAGDEGFDPMEIEVQGIVDCLREVLGPALPSSGQVRDVLRQMTERWRETENEPVLEFDSESDWVHIMDPFFAFYLKWNQPK